MKTWLFLDTNYLAHRAYHALGELTHHDVPTAVVFGVLKDVVNLQERFNTPNVAFCFDRGPVYHRERVCPTYKASRKKRHADASEEEKLASREFYRQVDRLRTLYLPRAGFRNIFSFEGFEGDDIIASLCHHTLQENDEEAVVVGSDGDLLQLVRHNVTIYSPQKQKVATLQSFYKDWHLEPIRWADIKAIAGCTSDDVPGIRGVGEISAAKYLRGELAEGSKYRRLIEENRGVWERNLEVVRLPFAGTPRFELLPDEVTPERWAFVCGKLGLTTLARHLPRWLRPKNGFGYNG